MKQGDATGTKDRGDQQDQVLNGGLSMIEASAQHVEGKENKKKARGRPEEVRDRSKKKTFFQIQNSPFFGSNIDSAAANAAAAETAAGSKSRM